MRPNGNRFVNHLISLVQDEMSVDQKETKKLLSGPPVSLQNKGVAILNLRLTGKTKREREFTRFVLT